MASVTFVDSDAHAGRLAPPPGPRAERVLLPPSARAYLAFKRILDVTTALALLILTAPFIGIAMLLVKLTSPGPALYSQTRLGRRGRPFTLYKLRTMAHDSESLTGPCWSLPGDSRVTKLGRWLRATHLDELPQLWNVLRGDMSFVGPRPERPEFAGDFERDIEGYGERFKVRPGLTGYAQVNGEYHTSAATKLKYDLAYMHNRSLWLDFKILADTVKVILTRRGV